MSQIKIEKYARVPLSREEMDCMLRWTYGDEGTRLAMLWRSFNDQLFSASLAPVPIHQPTATPYGHWIGLYSGNEKRETLEIQLKRGQCINQKIEVLLHEMIHQKLWESGECSSHNHPAWCNEIMRLTREIWGVEIWASPSVPRKVGGKSKRIQKPSPDGRPSIPLSSIARWPFSLGLTIPMDRFIERAK